MRSRPWLNALPCLAAVLVAQLNAGPACANSGGEPVAAAGNGMHPGSVDGNRERDPAGLSPFRAPASRAPTGQLYDIPYRPREVRSSESGWDYSGLLELGMLSGDADSRNALFRRYQDLDNGPYLNYFALEGVKPAEARFFEIVGAGVGRSDQFYGLQFGRYNDYRLSFSYSEVPHLFATTARPMWQGVGSARLTLPDWPGVAPGGASGNNSNNATAVQALINATADTELGLVRKQGSARVELNLTDSWKFSANYSIEQRNGARPFGANAGNGETVEPIDYKTHNLLAAVQFADSLSQFNLSLSASLFRNDIDTLTWENPFRHRSAALSISGGRLDLYPDNDAYNAKLEYARTLPRVLNGRFNATVALGSMRQNDKLIAPTITSGSGAVVAGGFNGNFNLWNSNAALSQQSADASVDTRLVDLGLSLVPTDRLTLRGTLRHYATRNNTRYTAQNPQTGQFGYIIQDTNVSTVFNGANNVHYRSIPFQGTQDNYRLAAEYQVGRRAMLSAEYERENFQRDWRERDRTWEDRFKFGYTDRGFESASVRLSYEHASRRGSPYDSHPYASFYTASLASYTETLANLLDRLRGLEELRKYDLADRTQQVLNARLNYLARPDLDLGLSLQSKINTYPAEFGRTGTQTQNSLNLDLSYLPSAATAFNAYYSYQTASMKQAGAADLGSADGAGCAVLPPACSNAFGAARSIYPADQYWSATSKDRSTLFGLGFRHDFGKPKLDLQYAWSSSRAPLGYTFASANALQNPELAAQAGSAFPDASYKLQVVDAGLRLPLSQQLAVRLYYRFEVGKITDWHYAGLDQGLVVGSRVYLDAGPRDYRVHVLGVLLRLTL